MENTFQFSCFEDAVNQGVKALQEKNGVKTYALFKELLYGLGVEIGRTTREKVDSLGLPPTIENFLKYSSMDRLGKTRFVRHFDFENKFYEISHDTQPDQGLEISDMEISRLFCYLDKAMLQGFSPELAQKHTSCLAMGSHSCRFVSRIDEE